ncbi:DUF2182 domain-containing protein [Dehalococcoidia bacterium]|nr:DUF2182 domain-containing protein [Dehalococcoidia bacterium]
MIGSLISPSPLNRDRFIILAGLLLLVVVSWGYLFLVSNDMNNSDIQMTSGMGDDFGMSAATVRIMPWNATEWVSMFIMWSVMMVGMMIPSASPMILLFSKVNRQRQDENQPYVRTSIFVIGYVIVWTFFSVVATFANFVLHTNALLSGMMGQSESAILGGCLLVAAGIFQWTPWKNACLNQCRTPMGFLMTEWRDGGIGALKMGLRHGLYCTACCWLIMLLIFVLGVMNLVWIAALSIFVLLEKVVPKGLWIGRASGVGLVIWGVLLLLNIIEI